MPKLTRSDKRKIREDIRNAASVQIKMMALPEGMQEALSEEGVQYAMHYRDDLAASLNYAAKPDQESD